MEKQTYDSYLKILHEELVPALGCTEPIAIAYAAAKAAQLLGQRPHSLDVWCSGNIIKNARSVLVPHSNGQRGVEAAAILGAIAGDANAELKVLERVTSDQAEEALNLAGTNYCRCHLREGVDNLYIKMAAYAENRENAVVCLEHRHTFFTHLEKNGVILLDRGAEDSPGEMPDLSVLSVEGIFEFANCLQIEDVDAVFSRQIEMNDKISKQGLAGNYGTNVGQILLNHGNKDDVYVRARAYAAAGSDARMNGCPLPVVINAGSGNQGITISVPISEYARSYQIERDRLYRALAVGNLISLHLKRYIGSLSAYCGATNAACGAACGIAYMQSGNLQLITDTIINTIATVGGMLCDGAKSSCAAKISTALACAFEGLLRAREKQVFRFGEGLVETDIEQTIRNYGRVGKNGMYTTDVEILNMMLHH